MKDEQTRLAIEALKAAGCGVLAIHVESRIAELEKDAARYRWLLDEKTDSRYYPLSGRSFAVIEFETESSDISEAIDTAMQKD